MKIVQTIKSWEIELVKIYKSNMMKISLLYKKKIMMMFAQIDFEIISLDEKHTNI